MLVQQKLWGHECLHRLRGIRWTLRLIYSTGEAPHSRADTSTVQPAAVHLPCVRCPNILNGECGGSHWAQRAGRRHGPGWRGLSGSHEHHLPRRHSAPTRSVKTLQFGQGSEAGSTSSSQALGFFFVIFHPLTLRTTEKTVNYPTVHKSLVCLSSAEDPSAERPNICAYLRLKDLNLPISHCLQI